MSYAEDRLYREVILKMMSRLASKVKVREIVPYLDCLMLTDREEIEAKREILGNYSAMTYLLDCLCKRENWPEQFISALRDCKHNTLADEISDAYDRIRGINVQRPAPAVEAVVEAAAAVPAAAPAAPVPAAANPGSPPASVPVTTSAVAGLPPAPSPAAASVTTATIHSVPQSTPPLLVLSPVEVPAQAAAPVPESLPSIATPAPSEAPILVSAPEAPVPPPPEPAQPTEPSPPSAAPHARPPSPISAVEEAPSLEQNEISFNSSLDSSDDQTLTTVYESSTASDISIPTITETTFPTQPDTPPTSSQPPSIPEESKIPLAVTGSLTSTKHPIQDTNPPEKVTVLNQDSQISSTANQLMKTVHTTPHHSPAQETSTRTTPSASNVVAGNLSPTPAEGEEYLSKPGLLAEQSMESSYELEISRPPTETVLSSPVQPASPEEWSEEVCSVKSDDLMISSATTRSAGSSPVQPAQDPPECTEVPIETVPVSLPTALEIVLPSSTEENSFSPDVPFSSNQPVEDHYESDSQCSQPEPDTLENTVQFSEEPSITNLNGEPPSLIGNMINDNPVNLNHCSPSESSLQSVISEDQCNWHDLVITKTNEAIEKAGAAADLSTCAEPTTAIYQESGLNASGLVSTPQSEQREKPNKSQGVPSQVQPNTLYIAAAAVISMAAIFVAWKCKH